VPWLQEQLTRIPEGIGYVAATAVDGNAAPVEVTIITNGLPTTSNFYNFADPKGNPRHIHSTETFKAIVNFPAAGGIGVMDATRKGTVFMVGTLYAAL
jgi:hypothetical protein